MMKVMRFEGREAYEEWLDQRQENGLSIEEIVCVVDDGNKMSIDLMTKCAKAETAIRRTFRGLGDIPELEGLQASMSEAVANNVFDESAPHNWRWWVDCIGENTYYVYLIVYRAEPEAETVAESEAQPVESEPAETPTIEGIAETFASQQKYYDEMWSYENPNTNDCLVQYWYNWEDKDGFTYKDHVDIFLSDACRASWVDFDCVDDGDIEGRVLEEMEERGYTVDDDNEIVIDDDMDEYAVREEMEDIRAELWEQAQSEAEWARDELCAHEDLTEKWFRELCEEMLDKVNATIAE